ncbi:MAG: carboxypeptidase regulatory-like domain-containing protein, partial [Acidobacteria bacterium]|nr:carboxypeptidase regulatory-like domain-containing protein [Acidobacteriota bacterium]
MFALFILASPIAGYAQEAVLAGTVSDSTGGVLPGVTVTAVHEATGNTFIGVTDERGDFRIPVRVGGYRITLELQGFTTVTRTGLNLLAGQTITLPLEMPPSALQETVTVTGEAPLVNLTQTNVSGNINPQQVREYNTNIDGQQVSSSLGGGRQPLFSQEMIAEMQFISNRFDATQGRSLGVQVNVISKSGTNRYAGSVRGNFRDDRFNAEHPVLEQVVPITEQQIASTFGGPILRDRLHFFAYHEYDRNPSLAVWNTVFPLYNVSRDNLITTKQGGVRLDYQLSAQTRLMAKGDLWRNWNDGFTGGNIFPGQSSTTRETGNNLNIQLTSVLSNRSVNEVKTGYAGYYYFNTCQTRWTNHWYKDDGPYGAVQECGPVINFTGFNFGGNQGYPRHRGQDRYWIRDDFSTSYELRGRHDLKLGGEFLYHHEMSANCTRCRGQFDARGGVRPSAANMQAWFPDPFNADTWNLAAISPLVRTFTIGIHKGRRDPDNMPMYGAWV